MATITKEAPSKYEDYMITDRVTVTLQTTSRHTIAALKKAGVLERDVELLTQSELERDGIETYEVKR